MCTKQLWMSNSGLDVINCSSSLPVVLCAQNVIAVPACELVNIYIYISPCMHLAKDIDPIWQGLLLNGDILKIGVYSVQLLQLVSLLS